MFKTSSATVYPVTDLILTKCNSSQGVAVSLGFEYNDTRRKYCILSFKDDNTYRANIIQKRIFYICV